MWSEVLASGLGLYIIGRTLHAYGKDIWGITKTLGYAAACVGILAVVALVVFAVVRLII